MTTAVKQLLESFDQLPETDQHQAAAEIMRRASGWDSEPLSDEGLIESADGVFARLDAEEGANGEVSQG